MGSLCGLILLLCEFLLSSVLFWIFAFMHQTDIGLINSGVWLLTEHGLYSATITSTFQDFMEG
jgi:hypothetical protein